MVDTVKLMLLHTVSVDKIERMKTKEDRLKFILNSELHNFYGTRV